MDKYFILYWKESGDEAPYVIKNGNTEQVKLFDSETSAESFCDEFENNTGTTCEIVEYNETN